MPQVLFLEFNEISFDNVAYYCSRGKLPHLCDLIENTGWSTTSSEDAYEHLEPWIQWVTAHTGLTFAEHGVFRLGDIVHRDLPQIWERLEDKGLKVGAICPMNAKHRLRDPAFFVPDPWTPTGITAPRLLRQLSAAISQAVNDNAQRKLTPASAWALGAGIAAYARPQNYARYTALGAGALRQSWKRALFLDLLLADIFIREVGRTQPHFSSLFLNGGAHIQHHYMFDSAAYAGPMRNPPGYVRSGVDPVLEVYELYDNILGQARKAFPTARVMVATALRQVPYPEQLYYWRLKNHAAFLREAGVPFVKVEARMSRDFLITCADAAEANTAAQRLRDAVANDGTPLFEVDNRGTDIFVMFVYPRMIEAGLRFRIRETEYSRLADHAVFVAVKNGEHDSTGYFLDIGSPKGSLPVNIPLAEIPQRIMSALGVAA